MLQLSSRSILPLLLIFILISSAIPLVPSASLDNNLPLAPGRITVRSSPAPSQNPHLYHAEAGARWLISIADEPSPGLYRWYESDLKNTNYYLEQSVGVIGIGKFLLKLYNATGNSTYLEYAEGAARWVISNAVVSAPDACKWPYKEGVSGQNDYTPDHYGGIGSVIEYLLMLYQITGNNTYLEYSEKGANFLIDDAVPEAGGYKWRTFYTIDYNMTGWYHGTAGLAYVLLQLYQETKNTTYLDYAKGAAEWLISIANNTAPGEYAWVRVQGDPSPSMTWCGGTTGIVQFFLIIWKATGNTTYLNYAKGGGNWMITQTIYISPGNTTFMYLNIYCHGDPSCSHIMFQLYNATGDRKYLKYAEESANWTISTGTQVNENEMKWPSIPGMDYNETSLLRGVSGIGYQMLCAYQITGNPRYLGYAEKAANWVENMSQEVTPGLERWNWEEQLRVDTEYYTGWYYGAAGICLFLLEIAPYWVAPSLGMAFLCPDLQGYGKPGENVTYEINIKNTGGIQWDIKIKYNLSSPSWQYIDTLNNVGFAPGEVRTLNLTVTVPKDALAGENCTMRVTAYYKSDYTVMDEINVTTFASAVHALDAWANDYYIQVYPEHFSGYPIHVKNLGNTMDDITLDCTDKPADWEVNISDFNGTAVNVKETRDGYVYFWVPISVPFGELHNVTITATSAGNSSVSADVVYTVSPYEKPGIEILTEDCVGYADPGEKRVFTFEVKNLCNFNADFYFNCTVVTGSTWACGFGPNIENVAPGNVTISEFYITPDLEALSGEWSTVRLGVFISGTDTEVFDAINFTVYVNDTFGIDAALDQATKSIKPYKTASFKVYVHNMGNIKDTYQFDRPSSHDLEHWGINIEFNGTDMQPHEHRTAWLNITNVQPITPKIEEFNFTVRSTTDTNASDFFVVQVDLLELKLAQINLPEALSGPPGANVTYVCRLVNLGNVNYTYSLSAESYSDWPSLVLEDNSSGVIKPLGSVEFTVVLSIPQNTPPGTIDNMCVWVYDNTGGSFRSELINTTVLPLTAFELLCDKTDGTVEPGGTIKFIIMVTNTGNVNATVSLVVTGESTTWAIISHTLVTIAPGKSTSVNLNITAPEGVEGEFTFYLEATSETANKTKWFVVNVKRDIGQNDNDNNINISDILFIGIVIFIIIIVTMVIIGLLLLLKSRKKDNEEWPEDGPKGDWAAKEENPEFWREEGQGEVDEDDWEYEYLKPEDEESIADEGVLLDWEE